MRVIKEHNPIKRWREQMFQRLCRTIPQEPSNLVAFSYLEDSSMADFLIEIDRLTLVVMYEESVGRTFPAVHLAGFTGRRTLQGVMWGGPSASRFFKDLTLKPEQQGLGRRLDARGNRLLDHAFYMHSRFQVHQNRYAFMPRRTEIPLPPLWAAYSNSIAKQLDMDHPDVTARDFFGLQLYPLDHVASHLKQATSIFADLRSFQTVRVVQLPDIRNGLCGKQGQVDFDFFNSRFRWRRRKRRNACRHVVQAPAT